MNLPMEWEPLPDFRIIRRAPRRRAARAVRALPRRPAARETEPRRRPWGAAAAFASGAQAFAMIANVPPCGSWRIAKRPTPGTSSGGFMIVPPSFFAFSATASQSSTAK